MIHYKISGNINYPVGHNLDVNIPLIKKMATKIKEIYPTECIDLWCRGSSGTIIASIIASTIEINNIQYVRRENESDSHSCGISNTESNVINIIVDDFICSGNTIKAIIQKMKQYYVTPHALCVTGNVSLYSIGYTSFDVVISNSVT